MRFIIAFLVVLCLSWLGWVAIPRSALPTKPVVVVSIKPIHSLVSAVMEGVGQPLLLMQEPGQSPHTFSLKPSDVLMAKKAGLLIWVGPAYETCLNSVVERLPQATLTLMDSKGLILHHPRQGGLWGAGHVHHHDHDEGEHHHCHDHGSEGFDGHIWLDPANAKVIATAVAEKLSILDPQHATAYKANAVALCQRLDQLAANLAIKLRPLREKPYVVTHDAYLYWDHAFGTQARGAVLPDPERPASPDHMLRLQAAIKGWQEEGHRVCLFAEPQLPTVLVQRLSEVIKVMPQIIDPLGDDCEAGKEAYFVMMSRLADAMVQAHE